MNNELFNETIRQIQIFEEVDAIALGGSVAAGRADISSDYDVYVYLNSPLSLAKRTAALSRTCKSLGIGRTYWGADWDDCFLKDGNAIELTYELTANTRAGLADTLQNFHAQNGYTTCFCYIIATAGPLYDPKGIYEELRRFVSVPYPEELRKNIIEMNKDMLSVITPSYLNQVEKALKRRDLVSVNHRIAEFVKTYFDILFALNRSYHPGEKRLLSLAPELCEHLPGDFEDDFRVLLTSGADESLIPVAHKLVRELYEVADKLR